jgi:hypothetical protein
MQFAMNVPLSNIPRLSAAIRAVAALALFSFAASGCGNSSPGFRDSGADAAPDAPAASPDGGSRADTRAMDAPVDVPAEVMPSDAGPVDLAAEVSPTDARPPDARDASPADAHPDTVTPVDASKHDAPAPVDASTPDAQPPTDAGGCVVATGGVLDWDVSPITLTGHLTVNGAATGVNGSGQFWLVDRATGDEALLGDTYTSSYSAAVVPKTYDVVYSYSATTIAAAQRTAGNSQRVVRAGVSLTSSATLDADIQAMPISGTFTVNGQPPSSGITGSIWLESTSSGDQVLLSFANATTTYTALVAAGTYDVYYRSGLLDGSGSSDTATLRNTSVKLASAVVISGARTLDIDVPSITVSGQLTVNGALISTGQGEVVLRRAGDDPAGDAAILGQAGSGLTYSARIAPGTYDVYFAFGNSEDPSGRVNQNARLSGPITLGSSVGNLNFDVPVVSSLPVVRVGGALVPSTDFGSRVELHQPPPITTLGPPDDAIVTFLQQSSFPAAVSIVPGIYDVYLIVIGGATGIPTGPIAVRNHDVRIAAALDLTTSGNFAVDVPIVELSGEATTAAAAAGAVALESLTQPGDRAEIALGGSGAYQANVVPDVYQVVYGSRAALATGNGVRNTHAVLRSSVDLTSAASASLDVAIPATHLTGRLSSFGIAGGGSSSAHIVLRTPDGSDSAHLSPMGTMTYSAWVVPGSYDVYVVNDTPTSTLGTPRNANARVGCAIVP